MRQKYIFLPLMFLVVGSLSRTCEAQQTQSEQIKMATAWKTWRNVMKRTPLPQKTGCFNASYPNTTWQKATCKKAPDIPYFPANGSRPYTVGGGNDALASAPDISSATGSFAKFTGLTSANGYSLQLNTNTFQTTACNGAADPSVCLGWEQFIFSEPSSTVFIQYWLIDWGQACPFGWLAYNGSCFINSGAVSIPAQSLSDLPYLQLSGEASGGADTAMLGAEGSVYEVTSADSRLNLEQHWDVAEYGVFGNGGGSGVTFNSGTTLVDEISLDNGATASPGCNPGGYTSEYNNLNLLSACCSYGGASPNVQFMESNDSNATASCGSTGLVGNFTPTPYTSNATVTVIGQSNPTIEYTITLGDTNPNAEIDYALYLCGQPDGGGSISPGESFTAETQGSQNCSLTGTMYATSSGNLASPVADIAF